jgi:PKD repeat protein
MAVITACSSDPPHSTGGGGSGALSVSGQSALGETGGQAGLASGGVRAASGGDGNGGSESSGAGGAALVDFEHESRDLTLSVDDAASSDAESTAKSYVWSFGDGSTSSGRTPPLHAYAEPGTYEVTLTTTDPSGTSSVVKRSITVAQRHPGEYAPDASTTGVPDIVKDRLTLLDLERPNQSEASTPTVAEETLSVRKSGDTWLLTRNTNTVVTLPTENAYVDGDRFVLDRLHLRGYLEVRAPNVTLRRSVIEAVAIPDAPVAAAPAGVNLGRRLVRGNDAATVSLRLEDVEISVPEAVRRGAGINAAYHHGLGIEASRLVLLRSEIAGTVDGMQIHQGGGTFTDVVVERSYLHDMQFYPVDSDRTDGDPTHSDAIQVECSLPNAGMLFGVQLLGNVLDVTSDPNLNAAIMVTRNACATSGLLIADNYLDGAVLPINVGAGTATSNITLYVNRNHFGPNRSSGSVLSKIWTTSTTAKVVAAKVNTTGGAAYDNFNAAGTQQWVFFSFEPPSNVDSAPPAGEPNANVMVDHSLGSQTWGSVSRGIAGVGLY